jgi:hypothetical protein
MKTQKVEEVLGRLSALKRFPTNQFALLGLAEIIQGLCQTDEEADRLAREALFAHDEWMGPHQLRRVYWEKVASKEFCDK